jgi:hypothetical protein
VRARLKVMAYLAFAVVLAVGVGLWFGARRQQRFVVSFERRLMESRGPSQQAVVPFKTLAALPAR